ncbi:MAG: energy-coupling factor ABC transporter ATP-binding protein [Rectinema sp.]|nr:energy-coupling factor ABC transporter ATP-binding protein [Rectinema sp.]
MSSELFRAEALTHIFPDGTRGLDSISLSIDQGEFLVLAGRNGAGKSLLMRHFVALSKQTSGTLFYRGRPLDSQIRTIRREVGYVFQDTEAQIFGQTVEEDLAFGPANLGLKGAALEEAIQTALREARLEGMASRRPTSLSGGEKRRLAVAGVLAMRPSCVILDEPFVNLDFPSVQEMLAVLDLLRDEGKTIIVLTHEIEKVFMRATRIVIMDSGRVVRDGSPREIPPEGFTQAGLVCPYQEHYPWLIRS